MKRLKSIAQELIGLFVDDNRFAVAILAWLILIRLLLPRLSPPPWHAPILTIGLLAILFESVLRRARHS